MRPRRHLPPLRHWRLGERLRALRDQLPLLRRHPAAAWALAAAGALMLGYLTAYLVLFPAPILPGRHEVPRVLGLTTADAQADLQRAGLRAARGNTEPHPTAPPGTVVWQDPPPGVRAPEGTRVTLVASAGPPKVPVPDVAGYEGALAQAFVRAAGLVASRVESVPAAAPAGIALVTRPPAGTMLAPGTEVVLSVSQGAPTITVPDLMGIGSNDARTRLEESGLQLGTVTRRRTYDAAPGTVVAQRPPSGTLAAPGTVVDIWVARTP